MAKSGTYTLTHGRNASLPTTDDCAIPGFEDNGIAASDYPHTPENSALEESPSGDRKESFRKLLRDVAERLGSSEVEQMELFEDIPEPLKGRSALALLTELWKRGKLSSQMTEPLIRLLRAIHRHDLANTLVVPYCAKYPDEEGKKGVGLVAIARVGYGAKYLADSSLGYIPVWLGDINVCLSQSYPFSHSRLPGHSRSFAKRASLPSRAR